MTTNSPTDSVQSPWEAIFERYNIWDHDFDASPFLISAAQIGNACQHFTRPGQKEARILCKQDTRESRPQVFRDRGLFILPVKNGEYAMIKGEGYVDIPPITSPLENYQSDFAFELKSSTIGNSEMQRLDYAYALSLIRHFVGDNSLVLTIRGRKFSPKAGFDFVTNGFQISAQSVQTEVDSGYEGENKIVLVEAKSAKSANTIIRQLYYPFRQWGIYAQKPVLPLFFQYVKGGGEFHLWEFGFDDIEDYNSIRLIRSSRYSIHQPRLQNFL